ALLSVLSAVPTSFGAARSVVSWRSRSSFSERSDATRPLSSRISWSRSRRRFWYWEVQLPSNDRAASDTIAVNLRNNMVPPWGKVRSTVGWAASAPDDDHEHENAHECRARHQPGRPRGRPLPVGPGVEQELEQPNLEEQRQHRSRGQERPERHVGIAGREPVQQTADGADETAEKEGQERPVPAEERADRAHEL